MMNAGRVLLTVFVVLCTWCGSPSAFAQKVNRVFDIIITDQEGSKNRLKIGVDGEATIGFDKDLDEWPIPPVPPSPFFDIRILDPDRRRGEFAGLDSYADIRPYVSASQRDTFYVRYQPNQDSYPCVFSWPADLGKSFEGATLLHTTKEGLTDVDMLKQTSVELDQWGQNTAIIILRGPRNPQNDSQ